ncbi:glycine-rich domain-containing protein [Candidatus Halocynthiibacter alkanivorans]|uniref:glycine-rich domain-containing protein n=1 Tax=Candidatus Halocynthiibacter alkanivorans TaxID=2267619 RepID=UPI000DF3A5A1|nr:hypothetical protein [Candidatus Halocynthiibacter alkanivorans]
MSQATYTPDVSHNDAAALAFFNSVFAAIASNNAGNAEPSETYPYMIWVDTSGATSVWKARNAANSGWGDLLNLDNAAIKAAYEANADTNVFTDAEKAKLSGVGGASLPVKIEAYDASDAAFKFTQAGDVEIYLVGGGGGGGSGSDRQDEATAHGGGPGGSSVKVMNVNTADSYSLMIGAGGSAAGLSDYNDPGADGGTGGTSTFTGTGVALTATGGAGGDGNSSAGLTVGAAGGVGSGGDYNYTGATGLSLDPSGNNGKASGGGAPNFGHPTARAAVSIVDTASGDKIIKYTATQAASAVYPGSPYADITFLMARAAANGVPFIDDQGLGGHGAGEYSNWSSKDDVIGGAGTRGGGGGGGYCVDTDGGREANSYGGAGGAGCLFVVYY